MPLNEQGGTDVLKTITVLIPAWKPGRELVPLVEGLLAAGVGAVVVVDDGSGPEFAGVFAALAVLPGVSVVCHAVNLGKGRALKGGFNHVLCERPETGAVVTADADGQHRLEDVLAVGRAAGDSRAVLGARRFDGDVPLRSRFGNQVTRGVFGLLTGRALRDTQTGLRGIPVRLLPELMRLEGERYDYEMTMLVHLCGAAQRPLEVPIATVYVDNNRGSHFDPVRDSMQIYFVLLRFYVSSLVAAGIDLAGFTLAFAASHQLLLSVAAGRLSSLVNFALNKSFVFNSERPLLRSLWRYYLLAVLVGGVSYVLIRALTVHLHWNVYVAKVVVDVLLSLVSFAAQRTYVFHGQEAE